VQGELAVDVQALASGPSRAQVLTYTLAADAYEVMVTGEKIVEYRKASPWNRKRLYVSDCSQTPRTYKYVRFYHGYPATKGGRRKMFAAEYLGFDQVKHVDEVYSNGLSVCFSSSEKMPCMYRIKLGRIVQKGAGY
jgi:hypothetical protein